MLLISNFFRILNNFEALFNLIMGSTFFYDHFIGLIFENDGDIDFNFYLPSFEQFYSIF